MGLFDFLDNPGRAVGIDPEQIDPRDRQAYRGMTLNALGNQMAGGTNMFQALGSARQLMDERQMREMEMAQKRQAMEAQQRQLEVMQGIWGPGGAQGAPQPPGGGMGAPTPGAQPGGPAGAPGGLIPPGQAGYDWRKWHASKLRQSAQALMPINPEEGRKFLEQAEKLDPPPKLSQPVPVAGPDGKPVLAAWDEMAGRFVPVDGFAPERKVSSTVKAAGPGGRPIEQPMDQYGQPMGTAMPGYVAPQQLDLGGVTGFVDPHAAAEQGPMAKSMTPGERASNAVAWANHGVSKANLALAQAEAGRGAPGGPGVGAGAPQGKLEKGFMWAQDPSVPGGWKQVPIPGSEAAQAVTQKDQGEQSTAIKAGAVMQIVDEARKLVGPTSAGLLGPVASRVGGTTARDLQGKLETIKANLGFDQLQAMREASPTGGALGQVAVQELVALQAAVASLDQAQSPAQLKSHLDKVEQHYNRWAYVTNKARQARGLPPVQINAGTAQGGWGGAAPAGGANPFAAELARRRAQQGK